MSASRAFAARACDVLRFCLNGLLFSILLLQGGFLLSGGTIKVPRFLTQAIFQRVNSTELSIQSGTLHLGLLGHFVLEGVAMDFKLESRSFRLGLDYLLGAWEMGSGFTFVLEGGSLEDAGGQLSALGIDHGLATYADKDFALLYLDMTYGELHLFFQSNKGFDWGALKDRLSQTDAKAPSSTDATDATAPDGSKAGLAPKDLKAQLASGDVAMDAALADLKAQLDNAVSVLSGFLLQAAQLLQNFEHPVASCYAFSTDAEQSLSVNLFAGGCTFESFSGGAFSGNLNMALNAEKNTFTQEPLEFVGTDLDFNGNLQLSHYRLRCWISDNWRGLDAAIFTSDAVHFKNFKLGALVLGLDPFAMGEPLRLRALLLREFGSVWLKAQLSPYFRKLEAQAELNLDFSKPSSGLSKPSLDLSDFEFKKLRFGLKGKLQGEANLKARRKLLGGWVLEEAQVLAEAQDLLFDAAEVKTLELQGDFQSDLLRVESLEAIGSDWMLSFDGFHDFKRQEGIFELEGLLYPMEFSGFMDKYLKKIWKDLEFSEKLMNLSVQFQSDKDFKVRGGFGELSSEDFTYKKTSLESATIDIWFDKAYFYINALKAESSKGILEGSLRWVHRPPEGVSRHFIFEAKSTLSPENLLASRDKSSRFYKTFATDASVELEGMGMFEEVPKPHRPNFYFLGDIGVDQAVWLGNVRLDALDARLFCSPKAVVVDDAKGSLAKGELSGLFWFDGKHDKDFVLRAKAKGIDMDFFLKECYKGKSFPLKKGIANLRAELSGSFEDKKSIVGTAQLDLSGAHFIKLAMFGPLSELLRIGLLEFESVELHLKLRKGLARIERAKLKSKRSTLKLKGSYDFIKRYVDATAELRPLDNLKVPIFKNLPKLLRPITGLLRVSIKGPPEDLKYHLSPYR